MTHRHSDIKKLLGHVTKPNFTEEEAEAMKGPQWPDVFLICCIDSRFQPDKALDYGPGVALEYRPIAAVIPPSTDADPALLSRMAFRRLKDVKNIVIIAHSDCGGAQASINVPNPDLKNGGDLDLVAHETHRTGLDIAKLAPEFLKAAKGDVKEAGNLLAKETSVQSFKNILGYKGKGTHATIEDEMKAGEVNVILLYYDLEKHTAEQYDPAKGKWEPVASFNDHAETPAPKALPHKPPKLAA
jgi:carbonic anhydrase